MAFSVFSIFMFIISIIFVPISLIFLWFSLEHWLSHVNEQSNMIYLIYLIHFELILDPWSLILDPWSLILDPVILDPVFPGNHFFRRSRQCGTSALIPGFIGWRIKIARTNVNKHNGNSEAGKIGPQCVHVWLTKPLGAWSGLNVWLILDNTYM